jgi:rod shape-determining protein MreC
VIAIILLSSSSKTHEAFFSQGLNEVTGRIDKQYSSLQEYFTLKETNRLLSEENARLRNSLAANFVVPDSSRERFIDTLVKDTLGRSRKFTWLPARVVDNSYTLQTNFITIERGRNQGVKTGMAVAGPQGIVGVVVETSNNFSKIMSLLHRNSKVSGMLKKDNSAGSVEWDGTDPAYLTLRNVTKGSKVQKGDTVVTSNYSANFPPKLMIGTVAEIGSDPSSNFYTLKIKTATNFFTLQYVYLIQNVRYAEQVELESTPLKNP